MPLTIGKAKDYQKAGKYDLLTIPFVHVEVKKWTPSSPRQSPPSAQVLSPERFCVAPREWAKAPCCAVCLLAVMMGLGLARGEFEGCPLLTKCLGIAWGYQNSELQCPTVTPPCWGCKLRKPLAQWRYHGEIWVGIGSNWAIDRPMNPCVCIYIYLYQASRIKLMVD